MALTKVENLPNNRKGIGSGAHIRLSEEDRAALQADQGVWYQIDGYSGTSVPPALKTLEGFEFVTRAVEGTESGRALFGRATAPATPVVADEADEAAAAAVEEAPAF